MTKNRIAIINGYRSPMLKSGTGFKDLSASDLGARILKETVIQSNIEPEKIDEVIIGNVAQPANSANIARVIALKAGLPQEIPAFTVHRNCASGMEALTTAADKINAGSAEIIAVGGVESMSNIPFMFGKKMTEIFTNLAKAKTFGQKFAILSQFRPKYLKPIIGIKEGLTDPISGLIMGCTAENVAKKFGITRQEQDDFALKSHQKAQKAQENNIFAEEIAAIYNNKGEIIEEDNGIRKNQKIADLAKLKPYFERGTGTVTVGNSSQITDGAAFMLVMSEKKAKELKIEPLGYMSDYSYCGLEPELMGLGPVHACAKLFAKTGKKISDFDLIELNEAFAAQVIGCQRAFSSADFAKESLGLDAALGEIDPEITNVNGGAIALGHPVGMTGARIIIHSLKELKRRNKNQALATLCIGGGQGGAVALENS